jgi:hypothetical protein
MTAQHEPTATAAEHGMPAELAGAAGGGTQTRGQIADPKPGAGETFGRVLAEELADIRTRRLGEQKIAAGEQGAKTPSEDERQAQKDAWDMDLVGLAISGGGIRSATFALGLLQSLADAGLLRLIDYLSTVSGGGYIGSWLAAWVKREGSLANVEKQLRPNRAEQAAAERKIEGTAVGPHVFDEEPEPVYHLRCFSSYLTPVYGLFSADTWTFVGIYVRNFLLNQLMLLPLVILVVLCCRLLVWPFGFGVTEAGADLLSLGTLALLGTVFFFSHYETRQLKRPPCAAGEARRRVPPAQPPAGAGGLHRFIVFPLLVAAVLVCALFTSPLGVQGAPAAIRFNGGGEISRWLNPWTTPLLDQDPNNPRDVRAALALALFFAVLHTLVTFAVDVIRYRTGLHERWLRRRALLASLASGLFGGLLFYFVITQILWRLSASPDGGLVVLGPPLALLVYVLGQVSEQAVLGKHAEEYEREWWARVYAEIFRVAVVWLVVVGLSLYGGWFISEVLDQVTLGTLASLWAVVSAAGARAGWSPRTLTGRGAPGLELLGRIAPAVFLVGLFALVSWLVALIVTPPAAAYWDAVVAPDWLRFGGLALGCALLLGLLLSTVSANLYSMNAAYANRLVRCYLGASRPKHDWRKWLGGLPEIPGPGGAPTGSHPPERLENPVTGFDPDDDLALQFLRIGQPLPHELRHAPAGAAQPYCGPFLLINTALNLVAGKQLAWQERKAEAFVLTPRYCGSKGTGYRELPEDNHDLTLGRAVSVSGAAVSPNMGYHSSPPLTALMTVFNVRLGWWLRNPREEDWEPGGAAPGELLWQELFSLTDECKPYVYLSDGGHFENLGVYELIRRRCRYLVVCDGAADPRYEFEDLANLIRKVRTDLGVSIEIDVGPLRPQPVDGRSQWHCAVGQVYYGDVDYQADGRLSHAERESSRRRQVGTLVYLKASLTGDEPADALNYAAAHGAFPHQSTVDQFFTESQFESYRILGYHIGRKIFYDAAKQLGEGEQVRRAAVLSEPQRAHYLGALFAALARRWCPAPPEYDRKFLDSTRSFLKITEAIRRDPNLQRLSLAVYPDLRRLVPADDARREPTPERLRAERHMFGEIFQIMEDVWLVLNLDNNWDHPQNRGWKRVFVLWTHNELFADNWEALKGEYSESFVHFLEYTVLTEQGPWADRPAKSAGSPISKPNPTPFL